MVKALAIETDDRDDEDIVVPTTAIPTVAPIAADKDDDVFDMGAMEDKLDEYVRNEEALRAVHTETLDAFLVWKSRLDRLEAKVSSIDLDVIYDLAAAPEDDFEPFDVLGLPPVVASLIGLGSGLVSVIGAIRALQAARALENVTRATLIKAGLGVAGSVISFGFAAYVLIRTTADRVKFLQETLPKMRTWFAETSEQITVMRSALNEDILPPIREVAQQLGVLDPQGNDNQTFRNLVAKLDEIGHDVASFNASYTVATRMLCNGFSVANAVTATSLPQTLVQARKDEIDLDVEGTICSAV